MREKGPLKRTRHVLACPVFGERNLVACRVVVVAMDERDDPHQTCGSYGAEKLHLEDRPGMIF